MTKIYRKDGSVIIEVDGKYCVSTNFNQTLYDAISNFDRGYAVVIQKMKVGLIDSNGNIILDCIYDAISAFDENGLLRITQNDKEGLFLPQKGWIKEPQFTAIYPAYNNLYIVCINGESGGFPYTGIINAEYFEMGKEYSNSDEYFNDPQFSPCIGGKYGIINSEGIIVLNLIYDKILSFNKGYAPVKKDNKWGIINRSGKVVIPIVYDRIRDIFESNDYKFVVQRGNTIYELNNEGHITRNYNELKIPQFDNGVQDINWKNCFKKCDLNFAQFEGYFKYIIDEYNMPSMYNE